MHIYNSVKYSLIKLQSQGDDNLTTDTRDNKHHLDTIDNHTSTRDNQKNLLGQRD